MAGSPSAPCMPAGHQHCQSSHSSDALFQGHDRLPSSSLQRGFKPGLEDLRAQACKLAGLSGVCTLRCSARLMLSNTESAHITPLCTDTPPDILPQAFHTRPHMLRWTEASPLRVLPHGRPCCSWPGKICFTRPWNVECKGVRCMLTGHIQGRCKG